MSTRFSNRRSRSKKSRRKKSRRKRSKKSKHFRKKSRLSRKPGGDYIMHTMMK